MNSVAAPAANAIPRLAAGRFIGSPLWRASTGARTKFYSRGGIGFQYSTNRQAGTPQSPYRRPFRYGYDMQMRMSMAVVLGVAVLALLGIGGCGISGNVQLSSNENSTTIGDSPTTIAYTSTDINTADVYLTDLPQRALDPGFDLKGVSGQFTQLHMFIDPKAGSTPIENSACSVTVRHVVIADGRIGVYGGGGFLDPNTAPGSKAFGGKIRDATCRLVASSPDFVDRLGSSRFDASFRAPRDDGKARAMAARLRTILDLAAPVAAAKGAGK